MTRSYVVTGAGRGVGRAVVERLVGDGHAVAALDLDVGALDWVRAHPAGYRSCRYSAVRPDVAVAERAADAAQEAGTFAGWVNNAAVFRDAALDVTPAGDVLGLTESNLAPAVVGSATAVRRLQAAGSTGAIVNVSSHQTQRAVRGALSHATAKAAIEGLTRALALDYGPLGIRANAVALGSVDTVGRVAEVAAAVAFLSRTTPPSSMAQCCQSIVGARPGVRTRKSGDPAEHRPSPYEQDGFWPLLRLASSRVGKASGPSSKGQP